MRKTFTVMVVVALTLLPAVPSAQQNRLQELATEFDRLVAELRALATAPAAPIQVAAGGDLQAVLDAAPPGAIIELPAGATFTWNFVIRKSVTVRTAGAGFTGRATLEHLPQLAQLVTGNSGNLIDILPGTTNVTLQLLRLGPANSNDIVLCGHGDASQTDVAQAPTNILFDQVVVEGDPASGAKRGITLNCAGASVTNSTIRGIWRVGQDSTGIGGWNGPGPFVIRNNHIEAASENILFGGSDPSIPGLIPTGIVIEDNLLTKDPAWRTENLATKNFVEFKTGRNVTVQRNRMGPQWASAQSYAIVITPSQYGTNPGQTVEDVTINDNEMLDLPGAFNILGHGQNQSTRPTLHSARITIRNNFVTINRLTQGGQGWFMQLGNCPRDLVVEQNTIVTNGNQFIQGNDCSTATSGFRFVGNLLHHIGAYGTYLRIAGTSYLRGARWADYFTGGVMQGNGFVGDVSQFRTNVPNNFHLGTCLERATDGTCTVLAATLVVDGYGTGVLEPYGRRRIVP